MNNREILQKVKGNPLYKSYAKHQLLTLFLLGGLIGAVAFIYIYGVYVLNPTYVDWLQSSYDLTQHYYGWVFYRQASWSFPIGMHDGLLYPTEVSIIYTDSIPLFAVFFKAISPILPETFQYFGIWGILCFMLQGGLGAILAKRFTKSSLISLLSAVLFSFSTLVIQRMYYHTALAGQWVILLAILVWAYKDYFNTILKNIIAWSVICCLSVAVQLYFLPMVVIIFCGYLLQDLIETKKLFKQILIGGAAMLCTLVTLYVLGAFSGGNTAFTNSGLGLFSYNLNGLFNSQNYFFFFNALPNATTEQWNEGFSYLGFGVILLLFIGIIFKMVNFIQKCQQHIHSSHEEVVYKLTFMIPIAICVFILVYLALSPLVTFNNKILVDIQYPSIIIKLLAVFRSSGRFIWPVFYGAMLLSIVLVARNSKRVVAIGLVFVCTCVQMVDLSTYVASKHTIYDTKVVYDDGLDSEVWDQLALTNEHIFFYENEIGDIKNLYSFANYASHNNMTLNTFYLAREVVIDDNLEFYRTNLLKGTPVENTIYLFHDLNSCLFFQNICLYRIDDRIVGLTAPIENLEDYPDVSVITISNTLNLSLKNDFNLINAEDRDDGSRVLFPTGQIMGPYVDLTTGVYEIRVTVEDTSRLSYGFDTTEGAITSRQLYMDDSQVVLEVTVNEPVQDFQMILANNSSENLSILKASLEKVS